MRVLHNTDKKYLSWITEQNDFPIAMRIRENMKGYDALLAVLQLARPVTKIGAVVAYEVNYKDWSQLVATVRGTRGRDGHRTA